MLEIDLLELKVKAVSLGASPAINLARADAISAGERDSVMIELKDTSELLCESGSMTIVDNTGNSM